MGRKFTTLSGALSITFLLALAPVPAMALPTFQTYISGATAGSLGADQHSWFYNTGSSGSFNLFVVGAYEPNALSLTGVTLLVSVPEGERGSVSFSTADEQPILLTRTGQGSSTFTNPAADADISVLTGVAGASGYSTTNFSPSGFNANNHYPLKDGVSDFLLFDLGSFTNTEGPLNDYNAKSGVITPTSATGEQKEFNVSITGFSWAHFDVFGLESELHGNHRVRTSWEWEMNSGSHDATAVVPEPATLTLLGSGAAFLWAMGRRRRPRSGA